MPQQQNKMAPVRGETTVPRHHNEPLVTSHKNRDSENHRSEFLAKVRKMAKMKLFLAKVRLSQNNDFFCFLLQTFTYYFLINTSRIEACPFSGSFNW